MLPLPDLSTVSLQHLRYLAALGTGATFADVAAELDVTQSAVSQGIARLERLLQVDLFEPSGRRRRLTPVGERVAQFAAATLNATESLIDDVGSHRDGRRGTLRIGMVDAAALYILDGAIASFTKQPDVELKLFVAGSDPLLERLARFEDELAVVVEPAEGFESTPLAAEALHLYGPTKEIEAGAGWVLYPTGSHTRRIIDEGLRQLDIVPRAVIESGNPAVQRQLARLTGSWTVLPAEVAETGRHRLTRRRDSVAERAFVLARRRGSEPTALAERFIADLNP